jgi:glycosyltransferase involved in cell wall biosynthesis
MVTKYRSSVEPLVSVIIPFYNSFDTISCCLDSVLNQTYKNLEVIVVDDHSSKEFSIYCKKLLDSDYRLKCFSHTQNRGVSAARNTGIKNSTGELIYFIDADDWISKSAIENLIIHYNNSIELFVAPHNQYLSPDNTRKKSYLVGERNMILNKQSILQYVTEYLNLPYRFVMLVHCWNKLYLAKIIKDNEIYFDPGLTQLEDVNFNFKYLKYVHNIYYSDTYDYFHSIENKAKSASGSAGMEDSSVDKCLIAFSSVKDIVIVNKGITNEKKKQLLAHHFVTTAIIYLIRLTRVFLENPSFANYNYIKIWIKSPVLANNLNYYKVQIGESNLVKIALKIGSTPLFIFVCFLRIKQLEK